jgi:hypothetical protein
MAYRSHRWTYPADNGHSSHNHRMPAGHHCLAYGTTVRVAEAAATETVPSMRRFVRVVANSDDHVVAGIQWSARTSPTSPRPSHWPSRWARMEYITATIPCLNRCGAKPFRRWAGERDPAKKIRRQSDKKYRRRPC